MANETKSAKSRTYKKRVRAEQEEATRERITAAAVKLHGSIGPAKTTVSALAEEAGVQRATVYRHFPDEVALFAACTAHYWARHPRPDIESWKAISDRGERLRHGLSDFYAFFPRTRRCSKRPAATRTWSPPWMPRARLSEDFSRRPLGR